METQLNKRWLAIICIPTICMIIPSHGETIMIIKKVVLRVSAALTLIYLYYTSKKQQDLNKRWLGFTTIVIAFVGVAIPSYHNETLKIIKDVTLAITFILLAIFLYYNRHNTKRMKYAILYGIFALIIGIIVYYLKTKR